MTATRYKGLGYVQVVKGLWRFVDAETGAAIGPHYKTKAELLADLDNFASVRGFA